VPGERRFPSRFPRFRVPHRIALVAAMLVVAALVEGAMPGVAAVPLPVPEKLNQIEPVTRLGPSTQAPPSPGQPLTAGQSVAPDGFGQRLAPELSGVAVTSAELDQREAVLEEARRKMADAEAGQREVQDRLRALDTDRQRALQAVTDAENALTRAGEGITAAENTLAQRETEEIEAEKRLEEAREAVQMLAVATYVQPEDDFAWLSDDREKVLAAGKERVMSNVVGDDVVGAFNQRTDERQRAGDAVDTAADDVAAATTDAENRETDLTDRRNAVGDLDKRLADTQAEVRTADERVAAAGADVVAGYTRVADARVLAMVDGIDFPMVALDAYWKAAHAAPCPIEWWALAGITKVESGHGTYRGASLDPRGVASPAIVGIPLNGTNGTAVIRDTDGGALDFDTVYDRAVGPMQFIPSTWARWAADGNGDGVSSPHDLYDVALGAARYLCAAAPDLTVDDGLRRGYFSYNHSQAYVNKVLGFAHDYRSSLTI
jgi:membrane-bound lytic murein transglycosylase B